MAGTDYLDYNVYIEGWERKYALLPPPQLFMEKSGQNEISSCNPLLLYLPKQQKKDFHVSNANEE